MDSNYRAIIFIDENVNKVVTLKSFVIKLNALFFSRFGSVFFPNL